MLLDISAALNTINHGVLLELLAELGLRALFDRILPLLD